jgi:spore maturation protein CgeB
VLGVNPRAEQGRIFPSDRVWSTLLARGLYVGERADSLVPLLQHGEHCVWFRNADECLRHCVELLSDCELREHIRDTGERHARENHTFDQRVPLILGEQEYVCRDETRVPYACSGSGGVVAGSSGIESSSSLQVEIAK